MFIQRKWRVEIIFKRFKGVYSHILATTASPAQEFSMDHHPGVSVLILYT